MVSPPHFDHEKLDVYQLELKFLAWVTQFLAACLDASVAKGFVFLDEFNPAKKCWFVLWLCLANWSVRFDPEQYRVRDSASGLAAPFEDEDDDEHEDEPLVAARPLCERCALDLLLGVSLQPSEDLRPSFMAGA